MDRGKRGGARRSFFVAVVAVLMVVVLAVVALAATKRVRADGRRWKPKIADISRGDSVRWRNPTNRPHDVTAWGGGWSFSAVLSPGESVTRQFDSRGTFKYRCVRHSAIVDGRCRDMCGKVVV
jgi:plastocyanin